MNKKTRSTKNEKWRHTCNSVEIAWTNEQKVAVTSYGRNKNHDDEIKNIAGQVLTYNSKNFHWLNRKLNLEKTMNGLGKPFRKKIRSKKSKKQKQLKRNGRMSTKPTSEKANFCSNTVVSLYFKFRAKKFHAAKALAFSLHFLFQRDQNHHSNLTSKIMKMCEQIFKKRQRHNTIQILWIVKNQEKANNSPNYRCAVIKNEKTTLFIRRWHVLCWLRICSK